MLAQKVACIIDAGAILAGKELKEIVKWLAKHPKFPRRKFRGISFCDQNVWKVYDLNSHEYVEKGTSIPDHETFVIFDEYRTRGADMKMAADVTAALSLSPTLSKDSLMQAVGRLRKIGRNQKVLILVTEEVKKKLSSSFGFREEMKLGEKVKVILNWTCMNSVKENQKFFLHNAKLATIHLSNIEDKKKPVPNRADTSLGRMYSGEMVYATVAEKSRELLEEYESEDFP